MRSHRSLHCEYWGEYWGQINLSIYNRTLFSVNATWIALLGLQYEISINRLSRILRAIV